MQLIEQKSACYEEEGKFEEAIAFFQAAMAGYQPGPRMTASLARVYATSGRRSEARRLLKEALAYADHLRTYILNPRSFCDCVYGKAHRISTASGSGRGLT